jgi:hypothetical protein
MARTRQLTDLIADVRYRADNKASTDAEITEVLNQSIADLYDQLCKAFGDEYFETESTLTTTANVDTIALPATFYKLTGVYWLISGGQYARISKYDPTNGQQYMPSSGWTFDGDIRYRLRAGTIRFTPMPLASQTVKLTFIPCAARLVNPTDPFDGYNGFEEYPIVDAAIKLLEREGNTDDAQLLIMRKQAIVARILDMADRDQNEPSKIQDTRATRADWLMRW